MATKLKNMPFTDFSGGLVTYNPPTELQLNQSPDLDNIILLKTGFQKRLGDSEFNSSAMNSGANIQMLAYYKEKGGKEYLNAIAGAKVYRSDDLDGTMDELTGASGDSTAPTAGQNNIYTPVVLKNLLMWFGPTAPQSWDGSTATNEYTDLDGTPPTADFAFVMKDRVFAGRTTANPSTIYWCVLSNPEDWAGTGSGNNAAATNDGDNLVGGIPLNNNLALLFKQYSIHQMVVETAPFPIRPLIHGIGCCGKNAMVNANGIVYFITKDARMKATDGYQILDFPDDVNDLWDGLSKSRLEYIQGIYDPVRNLIHWVCTNGTGTANDYDIIWDLNKRCWLRNTTGFDCNVMCIAQGYKLYGGHTDGKIYLKYTASTYNDASETSPGTITSYWRTPWVDIQNKFLVKQIRYGDVVCKIQTTGNVKYSYGYNYLRDTSSGEISQVSAGGAWGVGTWGDTFVWGGEAYVQKRIFFFGIGNNFQLKVFNDTAGIPMEIDNFNLAIKDAGVSEISR